MNIELPLSVVLFAIFLIQRDWQKIKSWLKSKNQQTKKFITISLASIFLAFIALYFYHATSADIYFKRNFYGINRIIEENGERTYINGRTIHGSQKLNNKSEAQYYYHHQSPIGDLIFDLKKAKNILIIGLGIGSLSAYSEAHQFWTYVDIDPDVIDLAQQYFTFLNDAKAPHQFIVGDGRIVAASLKTKFDYIIIDAFSSDSIPSHLITKEAFEIYHQRLNENGKILFHFSMKSLNQETILPAQANVLKFNWASKKTIVGRKSSSWFLMSKDEELINKLKNNSWKQVDTYKDLALWTDNKINLLYHLILAILSP